MKNHIYNFKKIIFLFAALFVSTTAMANDYSTVSTRFGVVSANGIVKFNGHIIYPKVIASSVDKVTQTKDTDYLLIQSIGGQMCAGPYYIAKVQSGKITVLQDFGSCDELYKTKVIPNKSIEFIFNDLKTEKKTKTYLYDIPSGIFKRNGKIIPTNCPSKDCYVGKN